MKSVERTPAVERAVEQEGHFELEHIRTEAVLVDYFGRILDVNSAFTKTMMLQRAELIDAWLTDLVHHTHRTSLKSAIARVGRSSVRCSLNVCYTGGKDLIVSAKTTISVARTADQPGPVLLLVLRQGWSVKKASAETPIRGGRPREESARIPAADLLATVAHELRAPLSAISLAGERIGRGCDAEQQQNFSQLISRQVRYMSWILENLLEGARTKRCAIALGLQPCELGEVIDAALELAQPIIEANEHELIVSPESRRITLRADPTRLRQVISNLLINAAKYTRPRGRIELCASTDGQDVFVRITDNGIGLTAADRRKLFRPFAQLKSGRVARDGVGLGLALSRTLVRLHGGSLSATSDGPGRGSCFEVKLPARGSSAIVMEGSRSAGHWAQKCG